MKTLLVVLALMTSSIASAEYCNTTCFTDDVGQQICNSYCR